MITKRLPQIGIVDQRNILRRSAISKSIARGCIAGTLGSPTFIATAAQIDLSVYNPRPVIQVSLNRPIGVKNAAPAAELYAALLATAIGSDKVDAIFKGTCHPPTTGALVVEPIRWKEQYIRAM